MRAQPPSTPSRPALFVFQHPSPQGADTTGMVDTRRRALLQCLATGGSLLLADATLGRVARAAATAPAPEGSAEAQAWRTLEAVQAHLFPSEEGAPGAAEINALAYLRGVLAMPDTPPAQRAFVLAGAGWLDSEAERRGGAFATLSESSREALVQALASSRDGENWVALVLHYIIEALLCDPVYGGNPGGVGWRWLDYTPGFPRPPADKRYGRLISL